jgi:Icc-related predicted phosphoesterase
VKLLALSDEVVEHIYSPQVKKNFGEVDLVVGCGDVPYYYLEFVVSMLDVPLYYVPGNHDKRELFTADGRVVRRAEGCVNLDARAVNHEGLLLAGLGGSIRYRPGEHNMYTESDMTGRAGSLAPAMLANRIRSGRFLDILLTHSPPRGIHDGPDPAHLGFDVFRTFMRLFKPRLLLHGHAHVYRRDRPTETVFGQTRVINVYPYRLIDLDHLENV